MYLDQNFKLNATMTFSKVKNRLIWLKKATLSVFYRFVWLDMYLDQNFKLNPMVTLLKVKNRLIYPKRATQWVFNHFVWLDMG